MLVFEMVRFMMCIHSDNNFVRALIWNFIDQQIFWSRPVHFYIRRYCTHYVCCGNILRNAYIHGRETEMIFYCSDGNNYCFSNTDLIPSQKWFILPTSITTYYIASFVWQVAHNILCSTPRVRIGRFRSALSPWLGTSILSCEGLPKSCAAVITHLSE